MIKKVKKGFTLIELVVVIAVIAILSAVSVVAYVGITNSAKKTAAQADARSAVDVIRASLLTNTEGYTEKSESTPRYTVILEEGKKLNFGTSSLSDAEIVEDMLVELEGPAITAANLQVDNTGDKTVIGVKIAGSSDYATASF